MTKCDSFSCDEGFQLVGPSLLTCDEYEKHFFGESFSKCVNPLKGFCEIWENKWWNSALFGNQPPHPPTFGKTFPKRKNFLRLPFSWSGDIYFINHDGLDDHDNNTDHDKWWQQQWYLLTKALAWNLEFTLRGNWILLPCLSSQARNSEESKFSFSTKF